MKTLKPNASEMRTKSPLDCVHAAHEKKLRMKIPMNSARIDFHKLWVFELSSPAPKIKFTIFNLS